MNSTRILLISLLALALSGTSLAQTPLKTPVDTVATSEDNLRIVIFSDYSWKYIKDHTDLLKDTLYTKHWSSDYPNPYRKEISDLPERVSLLLVDSIGLFHYPDKPGKVYSGYGYRHGHFHQGVDLPLKTGDPVYSAFEGMVRLSKYYKGYGNLIIIRHPNGLETFYAHLSKLGVKVGDWVDAGQVIGLGGATGRATGAHLHFETRYQGFSFNPEWIINFEKGALRHRLLILKRSYFVKASEYDQDFGGIDEMTDNEAEEVSSATGESRKDDEASIGAGKNSSVSIPETVAAGPKNASYVSAKEKAAAAAAVYHTVRSGDTLSKIAVANHTTVQAICKLNGISTRTTLKIGRKIRVR